MVTVGVQNKMIRNTLLLSRLAETNKAKKETARIQNRGVKGPTAIAVNPVACCWLMSLRATTTHGPSKAINIAASPLRISLT